VSPVKRKFDSFEGRRAPAHLLDQWPQVERRLRRATRVALLTDFDGTLVPIRRRPGEVRLSRQVRALLAALAGNGVVLGVVSGRRLSDVRARVGLRGIWYVGAHGYFLLPPTGQTMTLLKPNRIAEMKQAHRCLTQRLRGVPGIFLEPKQATVALHYRQASARGRRQARFVIQQLLKEHPGLHLLSGKKVWELLPDSRVSKWTAIRQILRQEREQKGGRWLVFYLGDDTTDERVFARMKGVTVAVGKHRHTSARFHLRSPAEVALFLERLREGTP